MAKKTIAEKLAELTAKLNDTKPNDHVRFSQTSKMPCRSISTPALLSCPTGCVLATVKNTSCSKCYTLRVPHYQYKPAQNLRLQNMATMLAPSKTWRDNLIKEINLKDRFIRIFDSGDLPNYEVLLDFIYVAENCRNTEFWLPTQERSFLMRFLASGGVIPDNLTIRLSAVKIDRIERLSKDFEQAGIVQSFVTTDPSSATCRSFENGGRCGQCRKCWDRNVKNISYLEH